LTPTWPHSIRPSPGKRPLTNKGSFLWFLQQFHSTHLDPGLKFKIAKREDVLDSTTLPFFHLCQLSMDNIAESYPTVFGNEYCLGVDLELVSLTRGARFCMSSDCLFLSGFPLALMNHDCGTKIAFEFLDGEPEV
jgi:hypothetical protein